MCPVYTAAFSPEDGRIQGLGFRAWRFASTPRLFFAFFWGVLPPFHPSASERVSFRSPRDQSPQAASSQKDTFSALFCSCSLSAPPTTNTKRAREFIKCLRRISAPAGSPGCSRETSSAAGHEGRSTSWASWRHRRSPPPPPPRSSTWRTSWIGRVW